ncbi:MAG: class I SAM-dependent methyltransferase [Armatimonadetes bacterium]|nr:class I SAM-dependent methyltransferase [Armatimonadota bacterium]
MTDWNAKPVLIAGKGPSFAARPNDIADKFHVVCINQTASFQHCLLAVMNDFESWLDTEPKNPDTAVALPAIPHWYQSPGKYSLEHWVSIEKSARSLHERGLLYAFDMRTTRFRKYPDKQPVLAMYSSTESAIEILALIGVKHMFTIGVDGGSTRSKEFHSTEGGPGSYDMQFRRISELQEQYAITVEPLLGDKIVHTAENLFEACQTRDDIPLALKEAELTGQWVELGVDRGTYSRLLLEKGKPDMLWSIDRWGGDRGHDTARYVSAVKLLQPYASNNTVVRASFSEAVNLFQSESLDFIYVDGYAHTGQESGNTLSEWWPKVKPGGVMAGHDYHERWPENLAAVDRFAAEHGLSIHVTKEKEWPSWIIVKSPLNPPVAP